MSNLDIYKFKEDLVSLINNSNLLAGAAYYVMKDVLKDLENTFKQGIDQDYIKLQNANNQQEIPVEEVEEVDDDIEEAE